MAEAGKCVTRCQGLEDLVSEVGLVLIGLARVRGQKPQKLTCNE